jgi:hypothetical protein
VDVDAAGHVLFRHPLMASAIHQAASFADRVRVHDALADALAFGLSGGQPPNPFLAGLAVLGLLAEAADAQPMLCVADDVQWLDRASADALAFVARRLLAERVAIVFGARERSEALGGFPELHVGAVGGARAAERLRLVAGELQMADVRQQVALSLVTEFENFSVFKPGDYNVDALNTLLDQVIAWSTALAPLRDSAAPA